MSIRPETWKLLKKMLSDISFDRVLEIGCGTGKNSLWLVENASALTSVDFSEEMLAVAKAKVKSAKVNFVEANITRPWDFRVGLYDLITFSLVLEHIEDMYFVFNEASKAISAGGYIYVGELHPFKQYTGSKARFESEDGVQVVECFNHHISDFISIGKKNSLALIDLEEFFDDDFLNGPPRILGLLFRKK